MADTNGHAGHKPDGRTEREKECERVVDAHIGGCTAAYLGKLKIRLTELQRERRLVRQSGTPEADASRVAGRGP